MRERTYIFLVFIILLAIFVGWLDFTDPHIQFGPFDRQIKAHYGLDIQGGLRVLLEPNVSPGVEVKGESVEVAKSIIEKRVNAFGVAEPIVQIQGGNRIALELAGITNPDEAVRTFGSTAQLEFIDVGDEPLDEGTTVKTTGPTARNSCSELVTTPAPAPTATIQPSPTVAPTVTTSTTGSITPTAEVTPTTPLSPTTPTKIFSTVMTGDCLDTAQVAFSQGNQPYIAFTLRGKGGQIFGDYTSANVGKFLAISLDKKIISSPRINSAITAGSGIIEGRFSLKEATDLAIQLRYGALPVPLKVVDNTTIGPTLGQDSVNKSLVAGAIGLTVVILFMLLYYRLPGLLADVALAVYGLVTIAIYKAGIPIIPGFDFVTLTLPGIAGFILSVGVAVDANILIFERMKEELRAGRPLTLAIEAGFSRAWPSIRDSNASTLITCAILYWYGSNFGASIVAGFALTLAIGVGVSLFTAILVTRTFLRLTLDLNVTRNLWWFGV